MEHEVRINIDDENELEARQQIGCVRLLIAVLGIKKIKIRSKKGLDKRLIFKTSVV